MDKKEIEDTLMDMELFKPDDIFYERVCAAMFIMLKHHPQIKQQIQGIITQYLLDAKLLTNEQIPRGE